MGNGQKCLTSEVYWKTFLEELHSSVWNNIFFSGGYSTEYLKHILNIVFNQLLLTTRVAEIFKHNDVVSTRYANANGTV